MRLIDADALILELQKSGEEDPSLKPIADGFISILRENCPTIESPRDWTPCAEGLPDDGEWIFVTVKEQYRDARVASCIVIYDAERRQYFPQGERGNKDELIGGVIAWQKFPDPYRADDTTGKVDHIRDATKKIHELKSPEQCTFRVRSVKDGHGDTERGNDWCNGYQKSEVDDEPCLTCQACKLCAANDQEED